MKIAVFVTIWASQVTPADLRSYFLDRPLAFLEGAPTVVSVDLFVRAPGDVALFDGPAAPALMIQIDFMPAQMVVCTEAGTEEVIWKW